MSGRAKLGWPGLSSLMVAGALVFFDQAAKIAVDKQLHQNESIPLIPRVLHITLVYNTGTAFGLLRNQNLVLAAAAFIAIAALIFLYVRAPHGASGGRAARLWRYAVLCILCGAVGNFIDRVRLGYVIDFIDVRVWPVFNIADSLITIGVILLLVLLLFDGRGTAQIGAPAPGGRKHAP